MSDYGWIDPRTGRAGCPACEGFGYHDDGTDEGELCLVCDGRGVATVDAAEQWLAESRPITDPQVTVDEIARIAGPEWPRELRALRLELAGQDPDTIAIDHEIMLDSAKNIAAHVENGTEDVARERYGDLAVDDWFRSEDWDPDAGREESAGESVKESVLVHARNPHDHGLDLATGRDLAAGEVIGRVWWDAPAPATAGLVLRVGSDELLPDHVDELAQMLAAHGYELTAQARADIEDLVRER